MLLMIMWFLDLLKPEPEIPRDFMRMLRTEYRSVPVDYVKFFLKKYNRLPTTEEIENYAA